MKFKDMAFSNPIILCNNLHHLLCNNLHHILCMHGIHARKQKKALTYKSGTPWSSHKVSIH